MADNEEHWKDGIHRRITLEFMDGTDKPLCIDRTDGAVADNGVVRFYRSDCSCGEGRYELYSASLVNVRGWG